MSQKNNIRNIYSLSPMQEGLLFHALLDEGSGQYIEQIIIKLSGSPDPSIFEKCFQLLIKHYDILRTVFVYKNVARPRQVLLNEQKTHFHVEDLSNLSSDESSKFIERFLEADKSEGFNLTKGPLIRFKFFKTGSNSSQLIISFHHVIMDGWCFGILFREIMTLYSELEAGNTPKLIPVQPYLAYIRWLEKQDKIQAVKYWKTLLEDYEKDASLSRIAHPFIQNSSKQLEDEAQKPQSINYHHTLDARMTDRLREYVRDQQITENTLFQSVWGLLCQKYCHTNDIVFGMVISGREADVEGISQMLGLFINTLPIRIKTTVKPGETFSRLLKNTHLQILDSKNYQYLPLSEIQSVSSIKNQLIDHIIAFENYPLMENHIKDGGISANEAQSITVEDIEMREQTNFDLNISISSNEEIRIGILFNPTVYPHEFTQRMLIHFENILQQIIERPDIEIANIDILSQEEKTELKNRLNNYNLQSITEKSIHCIFEEQVQRTPHNIAVIGENYFDKPSTKFGRNHLTYAALNAKTDILAARIMGMNIPSKTIIAIMADRTIETIIGILAILKSGNAYCPIDPDYPSERIDYILNDSCAAFLLTQDEISRNSNIKNHSGEIEPNRNSLNPSLYDDPAYVIYTSGSTGKPKGVVIQHCSLTHLILTQLNRFQISFMDRILLFSSLSFDASIEQLFLALTGGSTLVLIEKETILNRRKFEDYLVTQSITHLDTVPVVLNEINTTNLGSINPLKRVISGGDVCSLSLAQKLINGPFDFYNQYGPTEATVTVLSEKIQNITSRMRSISIGKPLDNTVVLILDQWKMPVPSGIPGEIVIGGLGLAAGYLNRPGLTAEKFIISQWPASESTLYCTGDLGRTLPDGNIEFIGRIDHQVKIRGFRIELGEIEQAILTHPHVKNAVVTCGNLSNGEKHLCAYIENDISFKTDGAGEAIREYLSSKLPDFMIPSFWMTLDEFPLTPNGKINTKALPSIEQIIRKKQTSYTLPRNGTEQKLCEIWTQVLDKEQIGIHENFFECGGHSLKAMTLLSILHKEFDIKLTLKDIFKHPSIQALAEIIDRNFDETTREIDFDPYAGIQPAEEKEYYPLFSTQKRLYLFQQLHVNNTSYNLPTIFRLEGELNTGRFEAIFKKLIERHESLRTSFCTIDGEPAQIIHKQIPFKIAIHENKESSETFELAIKTLIRPFDLSFAPLMRVHLVKVTDYEYVLVVDLHHIITDGVSMELLMKEFVALYHGLELPPLPLQFKDYSEWYNRKMAVIGETYARQENFWLKNLQDYPKELRLPYDFERPTAPSFEGQNIVFSIEQQYMSRLKGIVAQTNSTLFIILLAITHVWYSKLTGQDDTILGTAIEGRNHDNLRHIIGMFVNTLVMRNYSQPKKTFLFFLKEVTERTLQAFDNRDYLFEDLLKAMNYQPIPGRNAIFDIMFTLNNFEADSSHIPKIENPSSTLSPSLHMSPYPMANPVSKFDMTIRAVETPECIDIYIDYAVQLFKPETINRFAQYYLDIVKTVTATPEIFLDDIKITHGLVEVASVNPEMELNF